MFVVSVHRKQMKMVILLLCLLVMAVTFWAVTRESTAAVRPNGLRVQAETQEDRIAFLSQFGWTVTPDPVEVSEVLLPESFDDTYTQYNALQKAQHFDLEPYAGHRVKRWIYSVENYPGYEKNPCIQATLLVYDGQVIGGDVCSVALDGFMHGFSKEKIVEE